MNKKICQIIRVASAATLILTSYGMRMTRPVLICVENNHKLFVDALENNALRVITATDKKKICCDEMTTHSVDPFVFYADSSYRSESRLELIINSVKAGQCYGKKICRFPVVVTDSYLPSDLLEDMLVIRTEELVADDWPIWDYLPDGDDLIRVGDIISGIKCDVNPTPEEEYLLSAVSFLKPAYDDEKEYAELTDLVRLIIKRDDEDGDPNGITDLFLKHLYSYEEDYGRPKLWKLPELHTDVIQNIDKYLFFDTKYAYLHNRLFIKIVDGMSEVASVPAIKKVLADEEVLLKGSKKSYLSKMPVTDQYGNSRRLDCLRFDRKKLDRTGYSNFKTYFGGGTE